MNNVEAPVTHDHRLAGRLRGTQPLDRLIEVNNLPLRA
jgi:hypothetical protein